MNPVVPILIVVALVAVGVGAFFLLSGDDSGDSPEAVVEAWVDAASGQDCGAAVDLFSNASIEQSGMTREQLESACQSEVEGQDGSGLFSQDVELVSTNVTEESEDSATVEATIRAQDGENTQTFEVVKEDGEWRIDLTSIAGGGATPPPSGDGTTPPDQGGDTTETTESDSGDDGGGSTSGAAPPEVLAEAENENERTLANNCATGDMAACDDLWPITPSGSVIEAFSESCGGRDPGGNHTGDCEQTYG